MEEIRQKCVELLEALGATDIRSDISDAPAGLAIHEMENVCTGRDKQTPVHNGRNQCHEVPNLFVAAGACKGAVRIRTPHQPTWPLPHGTPN